MAAALVAAATAFALLSGCAREPDLATGHALPDSFDAGQVAGLPVTVGRSGVRPGAPASTRTVAGSPGGFIDDLATLSLDDVEDYWTREGARAVGLPPPTPVAAVSWSRYGTGITFCGQPFYAARNAAYCRSGDIIGWDRGQLIPSALGDYGEIAAAATFAHEYGHRMDHRLDSVGPTVLVREQRADCFAGAYLRWVASGSSSRMRLTTTDGLAKVLSWFASTRDRPTGRPRNRDNGHGTAYERVGAVMRGFEGGAAVCTAITRESVRAALAGLPDQFEPGGVAYRKTGFDQSILDRTAATLRQYFEVPDLRLSTEPGGCVDARSPAGYCPASTTVVADLPALTRLSTPSSDDDVDHSRPAGEVTGMTYVATRAALASLQRRGVDVARPSAALQALCLTGAWLRDRGSRPGDIDQALHVVLTDPRSATDTTGRAVAASFTRAQALLNGVYGGRRPCTPTLR